MANLSEALLRRRTSGAIFSGVNSVDEDLAAVHGLSVSGVPERSITEVSGLPGSGKTALVLSLILDTVRKGYSVLYVGCDYRGFPWDRMRKHFGWSNQRFDDRVHTKYATSIEQILALELPKNAKLIIFEHYETLFKRSWTGELYQRTSEACTRKFEALSRQCSVIATAGCIKLEHHELVVPGPAVRVWRRPSNMVRVLLYRDPEGNCVLSTGACFRVGDGGMTEATGAERQSLLLPDLSSKRQAFKPSPQSQSQSQSPKTPESEGMLTPVTKRLKAIPKMDNVFGGGGCPRTIDQSPSRKASREALLLSPDHIQSPNSIKWMPKLERLSGEPKAQPHESPESDAAANAHANPTGTSHFRSPLTQDAASSTISESHTIEAAGERGLATHCESFLDLEIVPNSQVDVNDSEYLLRPNEP